MDIKKYIKWLSNTNIFYYAITICVLSFIIRVPHNIIKELFDISDIVFDGKLPETRFNITFNQLFRSLVKAPIFETFFYQTIIFFIYKIFEINKWVIITLSSLLFASIHYYSIFYMIDVFCVGFLFMYGYILRSETQKKPFLSTALAHCFINVISLSAIFIKQQFFL